MSGRLIVFEGTDGSGKATQSRLLCQHLRREGVEMKNIDFPRYGKPSAAMVQEYLDGNLGKRPGDVNAYAASTFYAVDRYASYKTDWKGDWERERVIFCDRYTTSNAVHQSSKLPEEQLMDFTRWLFDYEYRLLGLPEPTCVIFLDMPPEVSFRMLQKRQGESGDIHELDHDYLKRCHERALAICRQYGWHRISCAENGEIRPAEDINRDVQAVLFEELAK